jgi:hypothetical protein
VSALKLFEITRQLRALEDLSLDEDVPPEVIRDTIEGLQGDFDAKAVDVAKFILALESNAAEVKEAAKRMAARAAAIERRADSVRNYLLFQMQSANVTKIARPEFVIRRATNPPAVQIRDPALIPAEYWVQPEPPPPRVDKTLLKAALKAGAVIEGAFMESGERVEIKL